MSQPAELVKLSEATRLLAECATIDEAKHIHDLAEGARIYAKMSGQALAAQNSASEIKLRAERRMGDMLKEMDLRPGRRWPSDNSTHMGTIKNPTLSDLDISKKQSSRFQQVASIPDPDFEQYLAETKEDEAGEVTSAGALRLAAKIRNGPHVGNNSGNNEWYTPAEYIQAARAVMGEIDLDPASSAEANEVIGADVFYTSEDDGLSRDWAGRVWMNPPYAAGLIDRFAAKLVCHYSDEMITEAIVLVNNATETAWFRTLVSLAGAVVFPGSRVKYWAPGGVIGAPLQGQAVIYFGDRPGVFLAQFKRFGWGCHVSL